MSLPYFPMYPKDFEAKTSHLTLAEDGAYNRLLRITWMTSGCTIPDDDAWIMRRLRCDKDTFDAVVSLVIDEYFISKKGRLINEKLLEIYLETNVAHKKRVAAGSRGGKAKALNIKEKMSSKAVAMPYQPEPEPEPLIKDTNVSQKNPKSKIPENWIPSDDDYAYAVSKKIPQSNIKELADEFQAYWFDRNDRDSKKSRRGWSQCWKSHVRRAANRPEYRSMASGQKTFGYGQGGGIADIAAQRRTNG